MQTVKVRTILLVIAALAAPSAASLSAPAHARAAGASYFVWSCDAAPAHAPSGWTADAAEGMDADRLCPTGGDVRRGLVARNRTNDEGVPKGASARTTFTTPAGTRLRGIDYAWSGYRRSGNWSVGLIADGRWLAGCTTAGAGECAFAHSADGSAHADLDGAQSVGVEARCVADEGCPTGHTGDETQGGLRARASMRWALIEIEDQQDPGVSELGGGLLADGWLSGTQDVAFSAGDNAGISATRVLIDGAAVDEASHPCVFARPVPCGAAQHAFALDTRTLADGAHSVELQALDAARNPGRETRSVRIDNTPPSGAFGRPSTATAGRVAVRVADAASGVAGGAIEVRRAGADGWRALPTALGSDHLLASLPGSLAPGDYEARARVVDRAGHVASVDRFGDGAPARFAVAAPTRLTARIAEADKRASGKRGPAAVLEQGRRITLSGRLRSQGAELARTPLQIVSRNRAAGAAWRTEARVRTDARGRFRHRLAPGASRDLQVRFAGSDRHRPARAELSVAVRGRATIASSRDEVANGDSVVFRGRVRGGPIPPGGKLVDLQAHYRGRWRTFALPRTDERGRWTQRYKFGATTGTVRYRFRARVPRERSYPYLPARSRTATVVVEGETEGRDRG